MNAADETNASRPGDQQEGPLCRRGFAVSDWSIAVSGYNVDVCYVCAPLLPKTTIAIIITTTPRAMVKGEALSTVIEAPFSPPPSH